MRLIFASLILIATALPAAAQSKSDEIRQPTGPWRVPGEIQKPRDVWQQPGEIQVPKGIQAVKAVVISGCERRLSVVGDALFDFDKSSLRPDAEETLAGGGAGDQEARRQSLARRRSHRLQGRRCLQHKAFRSARRDGARLDGGPGPDPGRHADPGASARSKPAAPNTAADGRDDPEGRQKNRRVEVVFDTCR